MSQELPPFLKNSGTPPRVACDYFEESGLDSREVASLVAKGMPLAVLIEWYERTGELGAFEVPAFEPDDPFSVFSKRVRPTLASVLRGDDLGNVLTYCANDWPLWVAVAWCEARHETFTDPYTCSGEEFELTPGVRWLCEYGKRPERVEALDWRWWSPDDGEGHSPEASLLLPPGSWHGGHNLFKDAVLVAAKDIVMATIECPACRDDGTRWCDTCQCVRHLPWLSTVGRDGLDWFGRKDQ